MLFVKPQVEWTDLGPSDLINTDVVLVACGRIRCEDVVGCVVTDSGSWRPNRLTRLQDALDVSRIVTDVTYGIEPRVIWTAHWVRESVDTLVVPVAVVLVWDQREVFFHAASGRSSGSVGTANVQGICADSSLCVKPHSRRTNHRRSNLSNADVVGVAKVRMQYEFIVLRIVANAWRRDRSRWRSCNIARHLILRLTALGLLAEPKLSTASHRIGKAVDAHKVPIAVVLVSHEGEVRPFSTQVILSVSTNDH